MPSRRRSNWGVCSSARTAAHVSLSRIAGYPRSGHSREPSVDCSASGVYPPSSRAHMVGTVPVSSGAERVRRSVTLRIGTAQPPWRHGLVLGDSGVKPVVLIDGLAAVRIVRLSLHHLTSPSVWTPPLLSSSQAHCRSEASRRPPRRWPEPAQKASAR